MIDCFLYVDVPEWWALHLFSWEVSGIEEKKHIFSPEKMELISIGSWDPETMDRPEFDRHRYSAQVPNHSSGLVPPIVG